MVTRAQELEDPSGLISYWESVIDCFSDLCRLVVVSVLVSDFDRNIPGRRHMLRRIVVDSQVCSLVCVLLNFFQTGSGLVHSGYPVVLDQSLISFLVDLPSLRVDGCWPIMHEIGHNFQDFAWTFRGFEEVVYFFLFHFSFISGDVQSVLSLCDRDIVPAPCLGGTQRLRKSNLSGQCHYFSSFLDSQNKIRNLMKVSSGSVQKGDDVELNAFERLTMYAELKERFGWEAFRKV